MRLIDADKLPVVETIERIENKDIFVSGWVPAKSIADAPIVEAIPIEQLLSILPKYDEYIHTKTYRNNETMEDIYSKGHKDGWNACLKAIKEELEYWRKENANTD